MNEKPLERLNYFNGQRLDASDLKLEQEYHIRVRRWLNKSLYSAGIARGLEVHATEGLEVVVSPGLALDAEGREIILLEQQTIKAPGKHNRVKGVDIGYYLTIQYREATTAEEKCSCSPRTCQHEKAESRLASGGPARVSAEPILGWSDILPHESGNRIALARVVLDRNCTKIEYVQKEIRRYVGAASAAKVRQYALEGERSIDPNNPGRIYFHVRGRQPSAVTLYLRAEKFSTLFYTEMGRHTHGSSIEGGTQTGTASAIDSHSHDQGSLVTPTHANHSHDLFGFVSNKGEFPTGFDILDPGAWFLAVNGYPDGPIPLPGVAARTGLPPQMLRTITTVYSSATDPSSVPLKARVGLTAGNETTALTHAITGITGAVPQRPAGAPDLHTHAYGASINDAGVNDLNPPAYRARTGDPLTFVNDMQIFIDGEDPAHNKTAEILRQLDDMQSAIDWQNAKLGNGSEGHPLVSQGTQEIKLDFLTGLDFDEGEHFIVLKVGSGGGRILYNLYVE